VFFKRFLDDVKFLEKNDIVSVIQSVHSWWKKNVE